MSAGKDGVLSRLLVQDIRHLLPDPVVKHFEVATASSLIANDVFSTTAVREEGYHTHDSNQKYA